MELPSSAFVTMEDLLEESAETEELDRVLDRLKLSAQEGLPEGWMNWKVVNCSKEEVFGDEIDPQVLNKLRFALPTVAIAKAFHPLAVDLTEKQYRDYKVQMLDWAFCRALIMSPPAITNKIKGSTGQAELFIHSLRPLKDLFVSRKQAASLLKPLEESSESEVDENERPDGKRKSGMRTDQPAKRSKLSILEARMDNMFQILLDKIEDKKDCEGSSESESGDSDEDGVSEHGIAGHGVQKPDWVAPPLVPTQEKQPVNLEALSLVPQVKESAPSIPPSTPEIKTQGLACQQLGTSNWNKIRYKEVQKKLQASPVFDALKVNSQLEGLMHKSFGDTVLEKAEEMAGTFTHGLLKQRQKLSEGMRKIAQKFPDAYEEIKENFMGESPFKEISDDLLHYTCARQAELIEMRRKVFKPKDQHLAAKMAEIPPSESHLFEEESLSKFFDQQGGLHKVFSQGQRTYEAKEYHSAEPK